jgi:hypothetical protein
MAKKRVENLWGTIIEEAMEEAGAMAKTPLEHLQEYATGMKGTYVYNPDTMKFTSTASGCVDPGTTTTVGDGWHLLPDDTTATYSWKRFSMPTMITKPSDFKHPPRQFDFGVAAVDIQRLLNSRMSQAANNMKEEIARDVFRDVAINGCIVHPRMKEGGKMSGPSPSTAPQGMCATPYKEEIMCVWEYIVVDKKNHNVLAVNKHAFARTQQLAMAEIDLKGLAATAGVKIDDLEWRIWEVCQFTEAQKVQIVDD